MEAQQETSSISALVFFFFSNPLECVRSVWKLGCQSRETGKHGLEEPSSVNSTSKPASSIIPLNIQPFLSTHSTGWLGPDSRTLSPLPVAPSAALSLLLIEPRWANNTQPRASLASHFYGLIVIVKPSLPPMRSRDHPSCFRISPSAASPSSRMWS